MQKRLEQIHDASMTILEEVGIKLHHPKILEILCRHGVKVVDDTAFFTRDQVMEWVGKTPERFTVYARNPKHNMSIGGDDSEFVGGYGCPNIIEADGQRRSALLADQVKFVKLVQQSDGFRLNGGILAQPSDLTNDQTHMVMTYAAIVYSDKCIMGQTGSCGDVEKIMDVAGIVFGGKEKLAEKPRMVTLVNTLSPLQMDHHALSTLLVHGKYRQPVVFCSGPMGGTTAPMTMAGTMAMGNAETLAAIAIFQMVSPGTPAVMAINAYPADMRTGALSIGSPAHALEVKYCAGLSKMYKIPCRCGGTSTDAKGVTVQSGYESMMTMFVSLQEKVNLIIHSAGILDSYAGISYEQFIVDLEIISMIRYYLKDMAINDNTLCLDVIKKVGPGGQFLTHPHTMQNCRKEPWMSELGTPGLLKEGQTPNDAVMEKIRMKLEKMLSAYEKPQLDETIQTRLDQYLMDHGIDQEFLNAV